MWVLFVSNQSQNFQKQSFEKSKYGSKHTFGKVYSTEKIDKNLFINPFLEVVWIDGRKVNIDS